MSRHVSYHQTLWPAKINDQFCYITVGGEEQPKKKNFFFNKQRKTNPHYYWILVLHVFIKGCLMVLKHNSKFYLIQVP